ncbi:hypothetical protein C8J57DRAFT_1338784 [Mycena rebaudengoi]|nr:hypothetical protein C8J57DRAFT_1338784 [Mycena rebaudengoi]
MPSRCIVTTRVPSAEKASPPTARNAWIVHSGASSRIVRSGASSSTVRRGSSSAAYHRMSSTTPPDPPSPRSRRPHHAHAHPCAHHHHPLPPAHRPREHRWGALCKEKCPRPVTAFAFCGGRGGWNVCGRRGIRRGGRMRERHGIRRGVEQADGAGAKNTSRLPCSAQIVGVVLQGGVRRGDEGGWGRGGGAAAGGDVARGGCGGGAVSAGHWREGGERGGGDGVRWAGRARTGRVGALGGEEGGYEQLRAEGGRLTTMMRRSVETPDASFMVGFEDGSALL